MRYLLTRADIARRVGVSRQAVSKAARPGKPLADAVHGELLDASHPSVLEWAARHGVTACALLPEAYGALVEPWRVEVDGETIEGESLTEVLAAAEERGARLIPLEGEGDDGTVEVHIVDVDDPAFAMWLTGELGREATREDVEAMWVQWKAGERELGAAAA